MNKIVEKQGNLFGALKLIEQLYLDGQISGFIFRNILKECDNEIDISVFKCNSDDLQKGEAEVCTE